MTPGARVQAAIDVMDRWLQGDQRLDRLLHAWGRGARYAGSGDRRAVGDLCYGALRRMRSAQWVAGVAETSSGRDLLCGALILDGQDPAALFTGAGHAPSPLTAQEQEGRDLETAPRGVRLDVPDWMVPLLDDIDGAVLDTMRGRAPVDLRVNLLKTDRQAAQRTLAEEGIETDPLEISGTALRITEGARKLRASRAYKDGLVELQDAASQAAADLADARPGETVLDLCAGAGGKTLALAASMGGSGRLLAHDLFPERMADLTERARRAGASVEVIGPDDLEGLSGTCDLVFIDAPCSGSGTWRRDPEAKWRLTSDRLDELQSIQTELLERAKPLVSPRGRLLYATCSLFPGENHKQVDRFVKLHRDWRLDGVLHADPTTGGDGFFAARLKMVNNLNQS